MLRRVRMCQRGGRGPLRRCYTVGDGQTKRFYVGGLRGKGLQDLHEAEDGDTVVLAEDRDEIVKEPRWPGDFGEDEEDALEDDEEVVDDRKHGATRLERDTIKSQGKLATENCAVMLDQDRTYVLFSR